MRRPAGKGAETVAGGAQDVAGARINRQATGGPEGSAVDRRIRLEAGHRLGAGVDPEDPTVVRAAVTIASAEGNVDVAIGERQRAALAVVHPVQPGGGQLGLGHDGSRRQVERGQVEVGGAADADHPGHVEPIRGGIRDRGAGDAAQPAAAEAGRHGGADECIPQRRAGGRRGGVERVDMVAFGGHEHMRADDDRRGVHRPGQRTAGPARCHPGEAGLARIVAGPGVVLVIGRPVRRLGQHRKCRDGKQTNGQRGDPDPHAAG